VTKYGEDFGHSMMSPAGLTREEQIQFKTLSSMGLTKKTWSSYSTAERMLAKCCKEKGLKFEYPVPNTTITKFVLWLACERKLSNGTISTYLAGIRQAQIGKGIAVPDVRSESIKLLLKGKANIDKKGKAENRDQRRQPITIDILKLIKARINELEYPLIDRRMLWTVTSILFFGAMRGNEILCKEVARFDPDFTLCTEDIRTVSDSENKKKLQIKVKAPKENKKGEAIIVDIFPTTVDLCPVNAFTKWKAMGPVWEWGKPAFRWSTGKPLTPAQLNNMLKDRLQGYVQGADKWFTSHSFRSGAASMMAVLGYNDEDIKAIGRWSSNAFETYIRLPRTKRMVMARKFAESNY
jgi:integrase